MSVQEIRGYVFTYNVRDKKIAYVYIGLEAGWFCLSDLVLTPCRFLISNMGNIVVVVYISVNALCG